MQALINNEIDEITRKIDALDAVRTKLEQDLLKLQEEELELDDERMFSTWSFTADRSRFVNLVEGVRERLEMEEAASQPARSRSRPSNLPPSSRRRKGEQKWSRRRLWALISPRAGIPAVRTRRTASGCSVHGMSHHALSP